MRLTEQREGFTYLFGDIEQVVMSLQAATNGMKKRILKSFFDTLRNESEEVLLSTAIDNNYITLLIRFAEEAQPKCKNAMVKFLEMLLKKRKSHEVHNNLTDRITSYEHLDSIGFRWRDWLEDLPRNMFIEEAYNEILRREGELLFFEESSLKRIHNLREKFLHTFMLSNDEKVLFVKNFLDRKYAATMRRFIVRNMRTGVQHVLPMLKNFSDELTIDMAMRYSQDQSEMQKLREYKENMNYHIHIAVDEMPNCK